jgi:hypothetical protein
LVAATWIVGTLLPVRHVELARAILPASPETIWGMLVDVDGMPDWRPGLRQVERLPAGQARGSVRWRETDAAGRHEFWERIEAIPPVRMEVRPASAARGWRRIVYRLSPVEGGTEIEIRDEVTMPNPLRRSWVAVFGRNRRTIDEMSRDLGDRLTWRDRVIAVGRP